jgi:hypothetical protein
MTTRTSANPPAIEPDPGVAVTPSLGPLPVVYVPRRFTRQCATRPVWHAVRRLVVRAWAGA